MMNAYHLEIKIEDGYLYAAAKGKRSRKAIYAIIGELLEACKEQRIGRVVVDARQLSGRIPVFDSISVIFEKFPEIKATGVIKKAAIIDSQLRRVRSSFFERVAQGRGYNLNFFVDPDEAIAWIRQDF